MTDKEFQEKIENKLYGTKPKGDMDKLSEAVKSKLKDFGRFSIN